MSRKKKAIFLLKLGHLATTTESGQPLLSVDPILQPMLEVLQTMTQALQNVYPTIQLSHAIHEEHNCLKLFRNWSLRFQGMNIAMLASYWLKGQRGSPSARVAVILRKTYQAIKNTYGRR